MEKIARFISNILAWPRMFKRLFVLAIDASLCVFSVWFAFFLRVGEFTSLQGNSLWAVVLSILVGLPLFIVFGLYRAIFRYSGWATLMVIKNAIFLYSLIYAAIFTAIGIDGVPRTIGLIQPILLFLMVSLSRVFAHVFLGARYKDLLERNMRPKVLIYGAGTAGRQLAAAILASYKMQVVGFLDDDIQLQGRVLNGQPVYNPADLEKWVVSLEVSGILLAIPSLSRKKRYEILEKLRIAMRGQKIFIRALPSVIELAEGKVAITDLKELEIEDLLGRDQVLPSDALLKKCITQKVILVTGAGGSIGSELCRQIMMLSPACIILVDQSEFALYNIHQELKEKQVSVAIKIAPLLASVCNEARMRLIMSTWRPDTVYHAAAYKHVSLVEQNFSEGIQNNVFGTLTLVKLAIETKVSDFVLVSTDKAVRPTSIMGASKRLAEMILQAFAEISTGIRFSMVRFGNVLGSSGSVFPKFRQQIQTGGPVTVTHPEVTRYFMTVSEAAQLVIQAAAMAKGGEVFVLDMGQSVKIIDLARRMIELSGMQVKDEANQNGDIEIKITGLQPGEKLYEELLIGNDPKPTLHPRILQAHEMFPPWSVLESGLSKLYCALETGDILKLSERLKELILDYNSNSEIVDCLYVAKTVSNDA